MADLDAPGDVLGRHFPEPAGDGDGAVVADPALQGTVKDPVHLGAADRAAANRSQRAQVPRQRCLGDARVAAAVIILLQPVSEARVEIVQAQALQIQGG